MFAGLPGTGIAGLFYIFSVFVMAVKEALYFIYGKSCPDTRRMVRLQMFIVIGNILSLVLTGWILVYFFHIQTNILATVDKTSHGFLSTIYLHPGFLSPFLLLFVLGSARLLHVVLKSADVKKD